MKKICLMGVGRMGRDHAKLIHQSEYVDLWSIVDPYFEGAKEVAEKYGAKAFSNAQEALDDPEVDAVLIASKTDTHADLIIASARAGKPIFCEKPIDINLKKITECLKVVEECGIPLMVGFNRRFDPSIRKFQQHLRQGKIGKLEQLVISSRDHDLPEREFLKASGGLFRDMMIHDFDMMRWLMQEEPNEVYATGSCLVDPTIAKLGDIDTAMVIFKFPSGAMCHINNSRRAAYGYDQRIEALGKKGMLRVKNVHQTSVEVSEKEGILTDSIHPSFPQRYRDAYLLELNHFFIDVINRNDPPEITGEDGRQAIIIANAAQESYEKGVPIKIPRKVSMEELSAMIH